jgi:hypothetical protein
MTIQSILKLLVCPLMLGIAAPSSAQTPSERIQIQSMLETYFKGQATGDATHFRKVWNHGHSMHSARCTTVSQRLMKLPANAPLIRLMSLVTQRWQRPHWFTAQSHSLITSCC